MKNPFRDPELRPIKRTEFGTAPVSEHEDQFPVGEAPKPMYWTFLLWTFGILLPVCVLVYLLWDHSA